MSGSFYSQKHRPLSLLSLQSFEWKKNYERKIDKKKMKQFKYKSRLWCVSRLVLSASSPPGPLLSSMYFAGRVTELRTTLSSVSIHYSLQKDKIITCRLLGKYFSVLTHGKWIVSQSKSKHTKRKIEWRADRRIQNEEDKQLIGRTTDNEPLRWTDGQTNRQADKAIKKKIKKNSYTSR